MLLKQIKTGDKVEIMQLESTGADKVHISQVENILDKDNVIIHAPIAYGQDVRLPLNRQYAFIFFTNKGMIRYIARITGYLKEDSFLLMRAALLSDGVPMQRRDFFRFPCLLAFKFTRLDTNRKDDNPDEDVVIDGTIKDISGGGIRFVCDKPIDKGEKILCMITLNNMSFALTADVRNRQHFAKQLYPYQYSATFDNITEKEQESIIQFIFNEQRNVLRRQAGIEI